MNPEVAHEHMIGLNFYHVVAQAIEAGKLFHIDLNDQKFNRYDQDLRFGSESIKTLFFVVKLLEESGYDGPRHFDAHAYRPKTTRAVWAFARGCMRTYLVLKDKARQFRQDAEIQAAAEGNPWRRRAPAAVFARSGDGVLSHTFDLHRSRRGRCPARSSISCGGPAPRRRS